MSFVNIPRKDIEQPLPPVGKHPVRLNAAKLRESAAKNQVLNIVWVITGTEPPAGERVLDNITLVPEAYWKLNLLFQGIEYKPDEQGFNTDDLIGKECEITIIHETGQDGVERAKVTSYKRI